MKESLPQQAAQRPESSTGSRQAAQSCGRAMSSASPNARRTAQAARRSRDDLAPAVSFSAATPMPMPER
jgi:hypothetical protein